MAVVLKARCVLNYAPPPHPTAKPSRGWLRAGGRKPRSFFFITPDRPTRNKVTAKGRAGPVLLGGVPKRHGAGGFASYFVHSGECGHSETAFPALVRCRPYYTKASNRRTATHTTTPPPKCAERPHPQRAGRGLARAPLGGSALEPRGRRQKKRKGKPRWGRALHQPHQLEPPSTPALLHRSPASFPSLLRRLLRPSSPRSVSPLRRALLGLRISSCVYETCSVGLASVGRSPPAWSFGHGPQAWVFSAVLPQIRPCSDPCSDPCSVLPRVVDLRDEHLAVGQRHLRHGHDTTAAAAARTHRARAQSARFARESPVTHPHLAALSIRVTTRRA